MARKFKPTDNCNLCGRLMNKECLKDGRVVFICKGEKVPGVPPHTTISYIHKDRS